MKLKINPDKPTEDQFIGVTHKQRGIFTEGWITGTQRQLDYSQKQVDELVGEIFGEIERVNHHSCKSPDCEMVEIFTQEWQALKQKYGVK